MTYTKDQFSENLFWDVHFEDIDFQKHAPYVVQRILEYGADKDWRQLVSIYGLKRALTTKYMVTNVERKI